MGKRSPSMPQRAGATIELFEVKTCNKCSKAKSTDAFYGTKQPCRRCQVEYQKIRYRRDPKVRERAAEARDRWHSRNPAYRGEYYGRTRERQIAKVKEYAARNPEYQERSKQRLAVWNAENPERQRARAKMWAAANPEASREHSRRGTARRRARLRDLPVEPYSIADIVDRDGTACVLCGEELDFEAPSRHAQSPSLEHLECISWPDSAGDVPSNVALSHWGCNNARWNRPHPAAARKRAELLQQARGAR